MKKNIYLLTAILLCFNLGFQQQDEPLMANTAAEQVNIALFLPLHLHNPARRKNDTTSAMYDYYEGVQAAITELENIGLNIKLHVFDDENDPHIVDSIFKLNKMGTMNTIIGPFFSNNHQIAEKFCAKNNIPLVSPFKFYKRKETKSFAHVNLVASDSIIAYGEGVAISRCFPAHQLVVVNDQKAENYHFRKLFKEGFDLLSFNTITTINENELAKLNTMVAAGNKLIVYAPTSNLATLTALSNLSKLDKIVLCLPEKTKKLASFGKPPMAAAKACFGENNYFDKYEANILAFRKMYRERFRWEANVYHYTGYDQFMFIAQSTAAFKNRFPNNLGNARWFGIMQQYLLHPVANGGFENAGCNMVRYPTSGKELILVPQR